MKKDEEYSSKKIVFIIFRNKNLFEDLEKIEMSMNPYLRELEEVLEVTEETMLEDVEGVEKDLIRLGYMPISKVVIEEDGIKYAKYIKVLNLHGQKVYVDLDISGDVIIEITETDVLFIEEEVAKEIPLVEPYQCLQGEICGVVSECQGHVCTLVREVESYYPRQVHYYRPGEDTFVVNEIAYPIIRLSSILADPVYALESQYATYEALRNQKNALEVQRLNDISKLLNLAISEYNEYIEERASLSKQVYESIAELETQNETYIKDLNITALEQAERKDILLQLKNRNEIVEDILKCSEHIVNVKKDLERIVKIFDQSKKECLRQVNT